MSRGSGGSLLICELDTGIQSKKNIEEIDWIIANIFSYNNTTVFTELLL